MWWGRMAFGVLAIIFGIVTFAYPGMTLTIFLWIFGTFLFVSGLVLIGYARKRTGTHRWLNLFEGVLNIIIAIVAFINPGLTALTIVYLVGFFAALTGVLQIGESFVAPRKHRSFGVSSRLLLAASGIWSLIVGVILLLFPVGGILAVLWIIATFAIIIGILNIVSGLRVRGRARPATVAR